MSAQGLTLDFGGFGSDQDKDEHRRLAAILDRGVHRLLTEACIVPRWTQMSTGFMRTTAAAEFGIAFP
jgi:hypothetical protein